MKKPVCVVGIAMHPEAKALLETQYEIKGMEAAGEASAALVYTVPDEWMETAPLLKAVGCHSHSEAFGNWAEEKGVKITLADSLWRTVAEHTLALAMAAVRYIPQADRDVRLGKWTNHENLKVLYSGHDFQGRVFGIWGLGQIGIELAKMLKGFNMQVLYTDIREVSPEEEKELGVTRVELPELLSRSDYFAVLVPHNASTDKIFGEKEFAQMKKGCVFINTGRAGIVERSAFMDAMKNGTIGAAALDVTWEEAMPQPEDMLSFQNLIFTPHLGGSTYECDAFLVKSLLL